MQNTCLCGDHPEFVNEDMSFERLYYNDPFSNILISCDFYCAAGRQTFVQALRSAVESLASFGLAVSLDENGILTYAKVGHKRNLAAIQFSDSEELSILRSLCGNLFDLPNGETLKIVVQTKEFGYTVYFCMHHIVGDANSLLLLIKRVAARLQGGDISIAEELNAQQDRSEEPDAHAKYLIDTINKRYPRAQYARSDYRSMHGQVYRDNVLDISKIILTEQEFRELHDFCRRQGVSITSYLAAELLQAQNVDIIYLAVNTRETENVFGNFADRIGIGRRDFAAIADVRERAIAIHKQIRRALADRSGRKRSEEILRHIHPEFFDDVIFDVYANRSNGFVQKMARLIGYKDNRAATLVSNLKTVRFDCDASLRISNLCFYPPHPLERTSTIGIVTQNDQLILTVQKFRKPTSA